MAAATNKTRPTDTLVAAYLATLTSEQRRAESVQLIDVLRRVSGHEPYMFGASIIGFSAYHYTYASGREGDAPLIGFAPRASRLTLYLSDGFDGHEALLEQLGPYKVSKACLYITRLDKVDLDVLERLCEASVARVRATWPEVPVEGLAST